MMTRPVWAEISRRRLTGNYRLLREMAGETALLAVVKANAYGHGARDCAATLAAAGAEWLGVTCVDEGATVRAVVPGARVVVMGGLWQHEAEAVVAYGLTPVVWEPFHLAWLEAAVRKAGVEVFPVHLEIDTGMARQGVQPGELEKLLEDLRLASRLRFEGVITHFHSPESLDGKSTEAQLRRFTTAMDTIVAKGFQPDWVHAGNSASLLAGSGARGVAELAASYGARAMLRPGLALYGYAPRFTGDGSGAALKAASGLEPVLAWKTRVVSLRTIEAGETTGYSATFRAERRTRLALLPAGYADGLNRLLSNRGDVLVRGKRAGIAGRVSMDLTIADVTDVPGVEVGDEVALIGEQGGERVTAYDHADAAGTIPYEILCNINGRVPRLVID